MPSAKLRYCAFAFAFAIAYNVSLANLSRILHSLLEIAAENHFIYKIRIEFSLNPNYMAFISIHNLVFCMQFQI